MIRINTVMYQLVVQISYICFALQNTKAAEKVCMRNHHVLIQYVSDALNLKTNPLNKKQITEKFVHDLMLHLEASPFQNHRELVRLYRCTMTVSVQVARVAQRATVVMWGRSVALWQGVGRLATSTVSTLSV